MSVAALLLIAATCMQPRCPSAGQRINRLRPIQTLDYDAALKGNELLSHEKTRRKLKCMSLSEDANLKRLPAVGFQLRDFLD